MSLTHLVLESLSDEALDAACIQRARNTETRVGRRTHLAPTAAFEKFCLENK